MRPYLKKKNITKKGLMECLKVIGLAFNPQYFKKRKKERKKERRKEERKKERKKENPENWRNPVIHERINIQHT
jgi:ribosomal protein RSM22 (predicted rRNA methylase)